MTDEDYYDYMADLALQKARQDNLIKRTKTMKASQLMAQLATMIAEHGDLTVIGQADQEGNSYETIRGADFTFVSEDFDSTVDTLAEAQVYEDGYFQPVIVIYP